MFMSVARGVACLAGLPVNYDVDDEVIANLVRTELKQILLQVKCFSRCDIDRIIKGLAWSINKQNFS